MRKYFFNQHRGYKSLDPDVFELCFKNRTTMKINGRLVRYGTAADIFNLSYISRKVGISEKEVRSRLQRLFDEHLALFVTDAPVEAMGLGLYYMTVKLKDGDKAKKEELFKKFLEDDHFCTGYETEGDFDFYLGYHISSFDKLKELIYDKYIDKETEANLLPVQRLLRQGGVNHWDLPASLWGEYVFDDVYYEKISKIQNKLDDIDLKIVKTINKKKPVDEYFNVNFFNFPEDVAKKALNDLYDGRTFISVLFLNWMKLNYNPYFLLVKLKPATLTERKIEIADKLAERSDLMTIIQHNDSYFDLSIMAYEGIAKIDEIKDVLSSLKEVDEIKEARCMKQTRMWTHRLDDENYGISIMLFD